MNAEYIKMGKRGTLVIPAFLRQHFGFHDGDMIIAEDHGDGVLLKPTVTLPVEIYTDERRAEFLLSSAITDKEYEKAKKEVVAMGLDPQKIPHYQYSKKEEKKKTKSKIIKKSDKPYD